MTDKTLMSGTYTIGTARVGSFKPVVIHKDGKNIATLHEDGRAEIDWIAVRAMAADVQPGDMVSAICALLWAATQPGVKP